MELVTARDTASPHSVRLVSAGMPVRRLGKVHMDMHDTGVTALTSRVEDRAVCGLPGRPATATNAYDVCRVSMHRVRTSIARNESVSAGL